MLVLFLFVSTVASQAFSAFPTSTGFTGNNIGSEVGGFGDGFGGGYGRRWQSPCGLPRFIDRLPAIIQYQVRAIWAKYREGDSCEIQKQQSRQLFWNLPLETKMQMRQGMRQRWMNRPCHRPRMLGMMPASIQQQMEAIWSNWRKGQTCERERTATHQLFWNLPQEQRTQFWQQMRQVWQDGRGSLKNKLCLIADILNDEESGDVVIVKNKKSSENHFGDRHQKEQIDTCFGHRRDGSDDPLYKIGRYSKHWENEEPLTIGFVREIAAMVGGAAVLAGQALLGQADNENVLDSGVIVRSQSYLYLVLVSTETWQRARRRVMEVDPEATVQPLYSALSMNNKSERHLIETHSHNCVE